VDETATVTNETEPTKQEEGRAQVGALVSLAHSVKTCGQLKYATLEQLGTFITSVPALVAEAMKMAEVRSQQSASGRSSATRRTVVGVS
jgi:hypothetical protein